MTNRENRKKIQVQWLRCRTDSELEGLVVSTSLAKHKLKDSPWKLPEQSQNAEIVNKILGRLYDMLSH